MDFLKKARKQVKSAVKDLQNQVQQQYPGQGSQQYQQGGYYPPPPPPPHSYTQGYSLPSTQHQHQSYYPQQQNYPQGQQQQQQSYGYPPSSQSVLPLQHHQQQELYPPPSQHYTATPVQQEYVTPPPPSSQSYTPAQVERECPPSHGHIPMVVQQEYSPNSSHTLPLPQQQHQLYEPSPSITSQSSYGHATQEEYNATASGPDQSTQAREAGFESSTIQPLHAIEPRDSTVNTQGTQHPQRCLGYEPVLTDYMPFFIYRPELLTGGGRPDLHNRAFAICGPCFHSKISAYPHLAHSFIPLEKQAQDPGTDELNVSYDELICCFSLPRVKQTFYRECVPQNTIQPLIEFAHFSTTLDQCVREVALQEYYGIDEHGSIAFCPRCFELFIKHTDFEHHFRKYRQKPENITWCEIPLENYLRRILLAEMEDSQPNWDRFMSKVNRRLEVPPCTGEGNAIVPKDAGPSFVYASTSGKPGLFCLECWYENIAETSLEGAFAKYCELEEHQKGASVCNLSASFSKFAMKVAVRAGDDEVWRRPVVLRGKLPACTGVQGVDEEQLQGQNPEVSWYHFKQHPSVQVCPHCYITVVELLGAGNLLEPMSQPLTNGVVRMCYFAPSQNPKASVDDSNNFENTLVWRGKMLRNTLSHGWVSRGNFIALNYIVKVIAEMPPPCGSNSRAFKEASGRKWLGHPADPAVPNDFTLTFCEECFEHYVKGTPLESMLNHDLTQATRHVTDGFACNTYSKRSRHMLEEACKQGDWSHFARYWAEREEVRARYTAILARMKQQTELQRQENEMKLAQSTQMASLRFMQQLNANQNAIISGIGGSVAEAAAFDTGIRYGNSTIGYGHLTPAGANSAQEWHNLPMKSQKPSVDMFQSSGNINVDTAKILELFAMIEPEWKAIE